MSRLVLCDVQFLLALNRTRGLQYITRVLQVSQMSSYLLPGLRFNDCVFSEPVRLSDWTAPACGGVVVVLAHDPNWAPKPFRPLYFTEFGNNSRLSLTAPSVRDSIFAAVLPLPYSTTAQRSALRDELVAAYNPSCQSSAPVKRRHPIGFAPDPTPATDTGCPGV